MSVDPLTEQMPNYSAYNYAFGNPLVFNDPNGIAPEHIDDPVITVGGGKDGRDLHTYTVTGKIINRSSRDVDMGKVLAHTKAYFENEFQEDNVNGIDIKFELDFSIAESMDDVLKSDHLVSLVDEISHFGTVKNSAGNWVEKLSHADGVAQGKGMAAFVDVANFRFGPFDSKKGSKGGYAASHEIGHLLGLGDPHHSNPFNLMKDGANWFSSANLTTFLNKAQIGEISRLQGAEQLNQGSNRYVPTRQKGKRGWDVKLKK